jgi:hypothetical protein
MYTGDVEGKSDDIPAQDRQLAALPGCAEAGVTGQVYVESTPGMIQEC